MLITVDRLTLQIVLMKIQGYSTHEIARYLKITEKAVYRHMDRLKEKVQNDVWIAVFMQLFLVALDKIFFKDYNYNSVIYHCYIGGVQNKRKWNDFRKYPPGSESRIFRKRI